MTRHYSHSACLAFALLAVALVAAAAEPTVDQIYKATQAGHYDTAQQMMDEVLRAHPTSGKAHYVQAQLYASQGKTNLARTELGKADELDPGLTHENQRAVQKLKAQLGLGSQANRIPLASRGGTMVAPVIINNSIKLEFTVDSGAADVTIPADVFSTLLRTETVTRSDMRASRRYTNATGETQEWETFVIRSLKIGPVEVANVEASVAPAKAPLLLGQSFLKRFKNWSIDNSTQELVLQR